MTLIDEKQEASLVTNLSNEFGLKKRAGGGSAANTIVSISQLGGDTFYACKVAHDESGEFYMNDLAEAGVATKLDQMKEDGVTGKCLVMVTEDAERTMNTFLGITSDFSIADLHEEELKRSEYIYIEGYLVTSDVSRHAAIHARKVAKENGVKTAITFSDPAMVTYFKDGITEIIGDGVDVLFSNEEEALTYTSIDPVKVEAIDTNGAGDMFAGAFMYGLLNGMTDEQSGNLASESAANIVTVYGARLEKQKQLDILSKHTA